MGIYPNRTTEPVNTTHAREWVERLDNYDGTIRERKVTATEWVVVSRDTCYCCSCSDNGYGGAINDPYCRNHGWYGERPCELHNMPGASGEDGLMPESVQAARAKQSE